MEKHCLYKGNASKLAFKQYITNNSIKTLADPSSEAQCLRMLFTEALTL